MRSTVDRYLLREIAVPFGLCLGLLLVVVTFGEILKISDGLGGLRMRPVDLGLAILWSLPPLLGLLIPICALFAVLLGVGRMAADREWLALWTAGFHPARMLRVPAVAGVVLGAGAAVLAVWGEPWGLARVRALLASGTQAALTEGVRAGQFYEWAAGVSFIARGESDDVLHSVLVADVRDPEQPIVIGAARGRLQPGPAKGEMVFALEDGQMIVGHRGDLDYRRLTFARSRYRLDVAGLVEDRLTNVTRAQGMTLGELRAAAATEPKLRRRALLIVTLHRKLAMPVATLIFALLAVPLAARIGERHRGAAVLAGAVLVAAYYYLGRAAELSARAGGFDPVLAAWLPNLLGLAAFGLLWGLRWGRR